MERDAKRDTTLAWMTAAFERQKRLPNLKNLLDSIGAPKVQTIGELRAAVQHLSEVYGLTLRKAKKGARHA